MKTARSRRFGARRRLALGIVMAGGLLVPGTAAAATVTAYPSTERYLFQAGAGEANTLTVTGDETSYTFSDSVPITEVPLPNTSSKCTQPTSTSLQCPRLLGTTPMVELLVWLANSGAADNAPNTFRYDGVPPPGEPGDPGLTVTTLSTGSNDVITGSSGNDLIQGFFGVDTISGEGGDDAIYGSVQEGDPTGTYAGGDGNDKITSTGGANEIMSGGDGDDYLLSGVGVDTLYGEGGNDTLWTYGDFEGTDPAGDKLDGGAGNDQLVEEPDTGCEHSEGDLNIGGPGEDRVYDDCGYEDVFKLKDGEPDKWNCGGLTGALESDPTDVLVAPKESCAAGPIVQIKRHRIQGDSASFWVHNFNDSAVLECKLDKASFEGCSSEPRYRNLKDGRHVFQVRAVGGELVGKAQKYRWNVR